MNISITDDIKKCSHLRLRYFISENTEAVELIARLDGRERVVLHHEDIFGNGMLSFYRDSQNEPLSRHILERAYNLIDDFAHGSGSAEQIDELGGEMADAPYFYFLYALMKNQFAEFGTIDTEIVRECVDEFSSMKRKYELYLLRTMFSEVGSEEPSKGASVLQMPGFMIMHVLLEPTFTYNDGSVETVRLISENIFDTWFGEKMPDREIKSYEYVLYPENAGELISYIACEHIKRDVRYKRCKNCGRLFLSPRGSNVDYCSNYIGDTGKTCRQVGAVRVYQSKMKDDPIKLEYTKAYKTHNARIRYGSMTKEEFQHWASFAREMRDKCIMGEITLEEFVGHIKR